MREASVRKTGRNPARPYVPVIVIHHNGRKIESQIRGLAYATRVEALAAAKRTIEHSDK